LDYYHDACTYRASKLEDPLMFVREFTHVLILGCGKTGLSIARYLKRKHVKTSFYDANKLIIDKIKNIQDIQIVSSFFGELKEHFFNGIDCIAVSPGVDLRNPLFKKLKENGVKFCNDISLFLEETNLLTTKVIGVTGTNGKTTVCSILEKILQKSQIKVKAAGNIGYPVLDIEDAHDLNILILELSSFQIELLNFSEIDVGIILNISEDHMDRYDSLEEYLRIKAKLLDQSKIKIINRDDSYLNTLQHKTTVSFGLSQPKAKLDYSLDMQSSSTYIVNDTGLRVDISNLKLPGRHNQLNVMAAIAGIRAIYPNFNSFESVLIDIKGIPHRLEWIRHLNGIDFYNDSKATNVGATIVALESFDNSNIFLIAGGDSKKQSLLPLKNILESKVKGLFLIGHDASIFENCFSNISSLKIEKCKDMKEAVFLSYKQAKSGDVVLLSPACASYDMYDNYIERGNDFKYLIEEL